jgi:hypothetical protein
MTHPPTGVYDRIMEEVESRPPVEPMENNVNDTFQQFLEAAMELYRVIGGVVFDDGSDAMDVIIQHEDNVKNWYKAYILKVHPDKMGEKGVLESQRVNQLKQTFDRLRARYLDNQL